LRLAANRELHVLGGVEEPGLGSPKPHGVRPFWRGPGTSGAALPGHRPHHRQTTTATAPAAGVGWTTVGIYELGVREEGRDPLSRPHFAFHIPDQVVGVISWMTRR
jgi:hypothetical protein